MDWQWAQDNNIPIRACPEASINMFQGTSLGAIKWIYLANHFVMGEASYAWKFLVIKPAPADLVLGLDFMLHHQPYVDFDSLALHLTVPKIESPEYKELRCRDKSQGQVEQQWVAAIDSAQEATLRSANVMQLGSYTPVWENDRIYLHSAHVHEHDWDQDTLSEISGPVAGRSVTASSEEERKDLRKFLQTLPPDLLKVVQKHEAVFAPPDREPPNRAVKHSIKLHPDAVPMKRGPYLLPPHKLEVMHQQIGELVDKGWIEKSNSAWGAPILFVPKKSKEWRMCVDYRDLNAVTVDDSFPLPRIEVLLHRAGNSLYLTLIDLASGFHQIEVELGSTTSDRVSSPSGVQRIRPVAMDCHAVWPPQCSPHVSESNDGSPAGSGRIHHRVYG